MDFLTQYIEAEIQRIHGVGKKYIVTPWTAKPRLNGLFATIPEPIMIGAKEMVIVTNVVIMANGLNNNPVLFQSYLLLEGSPGYLIEPMPIQHSIVGTTDTTVTFKWEGLTPALSAKIQPKYFNLGQTSIGGFSLSGWSIQVID